MIVLYLRLLGVWLVGYKGQGFEVKDSHGQVLVSAYTGGLLCSSGQIKAESETNDHFILYGQPQDLSPNHSSKVSSHLEEKVFNKIGFTFSPLKNN